MSSMDVDAISEKHISDTIGDSLWTDRYMSTKAEIIEYYQDTYTGRGKSGWKQHLINDLLPFTKQTGKNPAKNLSKRFDPQRRDNAEPRNKKEYENLGKTLPPVKVPRKWKGRRIRITIKVTITFSDGKPVEKRFTRTLTVQQTSALVEDNDMDGVMEAYGINADAIESMEDVVIESIEWLDD